VDTAAADMHSGMKGGSVQNANHALLQLLSGLWDRPRQVCVAPRACIQLWLRSMAFACVIAVRSNLQATRLPCTSINQSMLHL
jgi:hypothetical protein